MESNIRKLRIEKDNITQIELADAIGISQQAISRMERDRNRIRVRNLIALADFFHVSTDDILGYKTTSDGKVKNRCEDISTQESKKGSDIYQILVGLKECLEENGI